MSENNEDLQFAFRDDEFVAFTESRELVLNEPHFDFDDYHRATQTRVLPPQFQKLVQNALKDAFAYRPKRLAQKALANYLGFNEVGLLQLVAEYADMHLYILNGFKGDLMPHQLIALDFALSRDECLLALDMGLGKTPISLAYFCALSITRALIVCPASLKPNWFEETTVKFLKSHVKMLEITNAKKAEAILATPDISIFLISYELFPKVLEQLSKYTWDVLIADEAHALKNSKSIRAKAIFELRKKIKHLVLLTGTPSPTNPHLYNLLRFMQPTIFHDFFHYKNPNYRAPPSSNIFYFAERYVAPSIVYASGGRPKWAFKNSIRCEELHALTKQYTLRQKKQDVLDLPPLLRERVVIGSATKAQKTELETTLLKASLIAKEKGDVFAQALLGEQVRETAINKLPYVLKYITTLLETENQEKFIIWAHSKQVLQAIHEHLDSLKCKHIVINGDTNKTQRPILQKQLEHDPETRVAVLSLTACGTGGNWAFISLAIYAELTFLYVPHVQSEGRCHRIGQVGQSVVLHYLILKDSTDDMLWKALLRKINTESLVMDNKKADFLFDMLMDLQEPDDEKQPSMDEILLEYVCEPQLKKQKIKDTAMKKPKKAMNDILLESACKPQLKKQKIKDPTLKNPKKDRLEKKPKKQKQLEEPVPPKKCKIPKFKKQLSSPIIEVPQTNLHALIENNEWQQVIESIKSTLK